MTRHKYKRKLSNYLLKPGFQLKQGFYFLLFGTFSSLFVQWLAYASLKDAIINFHVNNDSSQLLGWLDPSVLTIGTEYMIFLGLFACGCFLFGIWVTHRIVGPMVPIKRFVSELKKGKYGHQIVLRNNDQLSEIAEELNELSRILDENHPNRAPALEVFEGPEKGEVIDEDKSKRPA